MAIVAKDSNASVDTSTAQFAPQITGLIAGENIDSAAPCYINSSDGRIYMSNGTAADEAAEIVGFSPRAASAGEPLTLFGHGTRFHYSTGMTPGDVLYIAATAGQLDTVATVGDAVGVAQVITPTDIRVIRDN